MTAPCSVWLSPLLALGGACAPANSLNGSMQSVTPLAFTMVEVKLQGSQLVIEYADFVDGGGNIPFELTVNTEGLMLDGGFSVLLDGGLDGGAPIALASRDVQSDGRTFSSIDRGFLNVSGPVAEGQRASGNFFLVFTYQVDGSLGSGHTVYGDFQAAVTQ